MKASTLGSDTDVGAHHSARGIAHPTNRIGAVQLGAMQFPRPSVFRFQTRMLVTYGVMVFILISTLGVTFYRYHARFLEERARETFTLIGDRIARQLNDVFNTMDFVLINLVSDVAFKEALVTLDTADRSGDAPTADIESAAQVVSASLAMHSFYRAQLDVVLNTAAGDLFSSDYIDHQQVRGTGTWGTVPEWHERVVAADGPPVVVGPFDDPWSRGASEELFGIARSIRGATGSVGILGSYQALSELDSLLLASIDGASSRSATVLATTTDGRLLHSSRPLSDTERTTYLGATETMDGFHRSAVTGDREFVAVSRMSSGWGRVVMVVDRDVLVDALAVTQALMAALGGFVFLVSVAYTYFSSRALTRPLRMIEADIEATDLQNLVAGPPIDHYNDELVALDRAFNRMKSRLEVAVGREITAHTAAVQARLEALQAQMNPHFLYNTLTVIANRGIELGDTAIGEICDGLASMLRYSTSTTSQSATIRDEVAHLQAYLYLMEQRLESRLDATVEVDPAILDAQIPKIVLQQIAENSIGHGYRDVPRTVSLTVRGVRDGGRWRISIADRGRGFGADRLAQLRRDMDEIDRSIAEDSPGQGFEIGGLGLLNTYARMVLFYDGDFAWSMENRPGGGAVVTIEAPIAVKDPDDA